MGDGETVQPEVTTWYEAGEYKPWRLASRNVEDPLRGEVRYETFAELLLALGQEWALVMPEPVT